MTVPGHVPSSGVKRFPRHPKSLSSHVLAELADHLLLSFAGAVDHLEAGLGQQLDTHVAPGHRPLVVLLGQRGADEG